MIYYQIYLIKNLVNGNTYIGQHKQNSVKVDNYLGSGILLYKNGKIPILQMVIINV